MLYMLFATELGAVVEEVRPGGCDDSDADQDRGRDGGHWDVGGNAPLRAGLAGTHDRADWQ